MILLGRVSEQFEDSAKIVMAGSKIGICLHHPAAYSPGSLTGGRGFVVSPTDHARSAAIRTR